MRFGMFVPQGWRHDLVGIDPAEHWETMRGIAQWADAGPWDTIWVYDHFHTVPVASATEATHEAWSLMSAYAATTSRVRLGQMCTCMSYRNPAYLAKIAATVDVISGGRVEMGIGGGWYEQEWRAYGYGFPPVAERLARLREGVEIMHQAWTTGAATLDGRALPGRRRDRAAAAAAGGRHPDLGRRRRREGDAQDRGEVRAVHELHGQPRGVRAQARRAPRALRGARHRLRRDHAARRTSTR